MKAKLLNQKGVILLPLFLALGVGLGILLISKVLAQTTDTTAPVKSTSLSGQSSKYPSGWEIFSGPITIEATATDSSGVAKVELRFRDQNDPLNTVSTQYVYTDTEAPYQFPWDTRTYPDGRQRYDVQAWDTLGNGNEYLASSFLAMNDPSYPPIQVITPAPGSTVSGSVPIEVSTTAANGIVGVYIDEEITPGGGFTRAVQSFCCSPTPPYRFTWDSRNYPDGPHRFRILSFEQDKFSRGDVGDPGEIVFEVVVKNSITATPVSTPTPTPAPTITPTNTPTPTPTPAKTGIITGAILNQDGQPIQGAKISLTINKQKRTYYTDIQGKYLIPDVPPGTYTITYVAAGYSQQKTTTTVTAGQTLVINVTLKRR